jgi:4-amino-4-deoxy-L-arabinose transferase-like glycosyltransferase
MLYPWHRLAGYPPDSGYMKIMLEQGWVGLILNVVFYYIVLQTGISGFYNARKKDIKTLYLAFTVCFFSLVVGQYSQLAISQYPQYFFYLATLVIFYKLKEYDTKTPATHEQIIT